MRAKVTRPFVNRILGAIAKGLDAILSAIAALPVNPDPTAKRGTWKREIAIIKEFLTVGVWTPANIPYTVFAKGNSKLPFYSFAALPFVTCPGMGACGGFCYSVKAFRYPMALFRMLQNTILIKFAKEQIAYAFRQLPKGVTVRLYTDGDFDSLETLRFWLDLCKTRADLSVYGYSKSWALFAALAESGYAFPENYKLNLSSGSRYGSEMRDRIAALPVVRGSFDAVPKSDLDRIGREPNTFVCPGKCGTCTRIGHACGSDRFKGVRIVIGIH